MEANWGIVECESGHPARLRAAALSGQAPWTASVCIGDLSALQTRPVTEPAKTGVLAMALTSP